MLGEFICGAARNAETVAVADATLDHLKTSIERFSERSLLFLNSAFDDNTQNFGAFCARVLLENSCAALVGRLDTFRLLYLAQFQAQQSFEYGRPSNSGFRWTGDVLPEDKAQQELWGPEHNVSKVSRALFSPYAEHVYWRPAVASTLDFIAADNSDLLQDLRSLEPDKYVGYTRGKCTTTYSTLSKGVHWDFFTSSIVLDEGTIKDAIRETLLAVGGMALISHFIPTSYRALERQEAVETYKSFRSLFQ
jgi:hypothetical protein